MILAAMIGEAFATEAVWNAQMVRRLGGDAKSTKCQGAL